MSATFASGLMTDLTGKVAVVTGAGNESGLALALHAADRGMKVALADSDPSLLRAAHERVKAKHVETLADCTQQFDLAAVRKLARRIEAELGPPWLVCNSGGATIESNLWAVINGVQVFTPGMVMRATGHIVNIASEDLFCIRGAAVDIAVGHAIVGLSESLYRELDSIRSPVGVTVVCPAPINTNVTDASRPMRLPARDAGLRVVPPEELAQRIFAAIERREFRLSSRAPQMRETTHASADAASGNRAGRRDHRERAQSLAGALPF